MFRIMITILSLIGTTISFVTCLKGDWIEGLLWLIVSGLAIIMGDLRSIEKKLK